MIKSIVIDDEPISLKVIENFCKELDYISVDKTFTNAEDGLKYLKKFPTDIIFLDIEMPNLNGIDLYKQVKQNTLVIFITSRPDYAVEGFNLNALDYLLKPFTFERFVQATEKARDYFSSHNNTKPNHLFIRADYSLQKINLDDILYIEALDDYLKIYIENQKTIVARLTMKAIMGKLPASMFVRVHRSFIVPVKRVESIRNKTISIQDKHIPIGNSYDEELQKHFKL